MALAATLTLTGCAVRGSQPPVDDGGRLGAYIAEVERLNAQGESKRLDGHCASACTIFLGVRHVCVTPRARLWFHAAHLTVPGVTPDPLGTLKVLSYYPDHVRAWAIRTRAVETLQFSESHSLTGEQLVLMGVAACAQG